MPLYFAVFVALLFRTLIFSSTFWHLHASYEAYRQVLAKSCLVCSDQAQIFFSTWQQFPLATLHLSHHWGKSYKCRLSQIKQSWQPTSWSSRFDLTRGSHAPDLPLIGFPYEASQQLKAHSSTCALNLKPIYCKQGYDLALSSLQPQR